MSARPWSILYMPILGGIALIERMRNDPRFAGTRILAISASIEDARARSLAAGADGFLQKPLRMLDIVDALAHLLHLDRA